MKLVDVSETVMIVVGAAERAERDRALAETLCREIDGRADGQPYRRAVVVADVEFLERPELHRHPTIAVGGPGVNAVVQRLVDELPTMWEQDERAFVQGEFDEVKRVAIWGTDAAATARAVEAFLTGGYLDLLLDRIWRARPTVWM